DKTLDGAATDVQAAINQASGSLPVDLPSPPTFSKTNPNDQPLQYIAVTSDSVTPGQLYDYASTQVGQRLSILPGVSRVQIFGSKAAVRIVLIYDRSASIVSSVEDVRDTLLIAFVLVVLVIFLFLGRATDTLIPAVAMPLSLLLTFVAMRLLGYSLDNLSLMALTLAIGFLVDDAIVFLENTVRRMEHGENALQASLASAKEISFTILSMTLSLAAVFIPLVFMPGLIGRIFREFAITIVVAIFASGVVSLTLTPLMTARMLKERDGRKTWMERAS